MSNAEVKAVLYDALRKQAIGDDFADRLADGMAASLTPFFRRKQREDLAAYYLAHVYAKHADDYSDNAMLDRAFELAEAFIARCDNYKP